MRSVEVSASTREEAITMALDKLGAERHEVDVEILDEGSRGLFGLGARPVRLRVTDESARHEPEAQKPPRKQREDSGEAPAASRTPAASTSEREGDREKRPRGRRGGRRGRGGSRPEGETQETAPARGGDEQKQTRGERGGRPERGERADRPERSERSERGGRGGRGRGARPEASADSQQNAPAPNADANQPTNDDSESGERPRRRRRRGGATRREGVRRETRTPTEKSGGSDENQSRSEAPARRSQRDDAPVRPERAERPERNRDRDSERAPRQAPQPTEPISEERATEASALLTEIVEMMGMEAQVVHELQDDGGCTLRVATEDSALLIGRKAQTLLALQYLVNRVIRQHEEENLQLIMVDIEGYIERRREELTELALRMAEQAKEERRRVRLKPLTPQERRIVHVALQEDEDLRTFSVGDGAMRSVVIAPKDEESPPPRGGRGGRGGRRENGDSRQRRVHGRFSDEENASDEPGNPDRGGNTEVTVNHGAGGDHSNDDETRRPDEA